MLNKFYDMFFILEIECLFVTEKKQDIASFRLKNVIVHDIELDLVRLHTNSEKVFQAYWYFSYVDIIIIILFLIKNLHFTVGLAQS